LQKIKFSFSVLRVLVKRTLLLIRSTGHSIHLGLPLKYSLFPLLPRLRWGYLASQPRSQQCDSQLAKSVDVIISLYKFERYQSIIEKSVESCINNPRITLHFVLVSASPAEVAWAQNIVGGLHHKIHLSKDRIGIYEAWNIGIQNGSSDLITNLNADDLRIPHSLCEQAAHLQRTGLDGSYGNFALSLDIFESLRSPRGRHLLSNLGKFEIETLIEESENYMHCAPMWKRDLHNRFGFFDSSLVSSGDTEFWLRCLDSSAKFDLYPPVTAIYFHNPEGLSTSASSAGSKEWGKIRSRYLMDKSRS